MLLFIHETLIYGQNTHADYTLDSVIVSAKEKRFLRAVQMSASSIPVSVVRTMPSVLGEMDIFKSLQMMPGVHGGGDGNVSLHIRGGASSQNLFLIDGMPLYNPEHFKGYVSAISPAYIEDAILYKGGFPAQFGNRLSGIIDVATKRGDFNEYHGQVSAGLFSASATFGGPILKNKLSFSVSGRKSYFKEVTTPFIDWLYDDADISDDGDDYNFPFENISFYDFNTKVSYRPDRRNIIDISLYKGQDMNGLGELKQKSASTNEDKSEIYETVYTDSSDEDWGNMLGGISWKYADEYVAVNARYSYSAYSYEERFNKGTIINTYSGPDAVLSDWNKESRCSEYMLDVERHQFSGNAEIKDGILKNLEVGFDMGYGLYRPGYRLSTVKESYNGIAGIERSVMEDSRNLISGGVFATYNLKFGKSVLVDVGLRGAYHIAGKKTYFYPEPRISLLYNITEKIQFKTAYSAISQSEHKISTSDLLEDSDMWLPSTDQIKPSTSRQIAAGCVFDFKDKGGWIASVEGYYKDVQDVLEYKTGSIAATDAGEWEESVADGDGWAYGVEFMIQKNSGNTTGWLSYTWSKSILKFNKEGMVLNNGESFYAPYDCRNRITLNFTQKLTKDISIAASFSYNTGRFRTVDNLTYQFVYKGNSGLLQNTSEPALVYKHHYYKQTMASKRNNVKLDDYHRLDISLNYNINHRKIAGESNVVLGITNIYNNYNISFIRGGFPLVKVCIFPIMPSLSYSFEF